MNFGTQSLLYSFQLNYFYKLNHISRDCILLLPMCVIQPSHYFFQVPGRRERGRRAGLHKTRSTNTHSDLVREFTLLCSQIINFTSSILLGQFTRSPPRYFHFAWNLKCRRIIRKISSLNFLLFVQGLLWLYVTLDAFHYHLLYILGLGNKKSGLT